MDAVKVLCIHMSETIIIIDSYLCDSEQKMEVHPNETLAVDLICHARIPAVNFAKRSLVG
jgi:hypothetical protein